MIRKRAKITCHFFTLEGGIIWQVEKYSAVPA
jgi:hypothetical protein